MKIESMKDLIAYQKAYALAMRVFELTKRFPAEERFALTSQIRVGKLIGSMVNDPAKWLIRPDL